MSPFLYQIVSKVRLSKENCLSSPIWIQYHSNIFHFQTNYCRNYNLKLINTLLATSNTIIRNFFLIEEIVYFFAHKLKRFLHIHPLHILFAEVSYPNIQTVTKTRRFRQIGERPKNIMSLQVIDMASYDIYVCTYVYVYPTNGRKNLITKEALYVQHLQKQRQNKA